MLSVASACHGLLPLLERWDQYWYSESLQIAADLARKRVNKHSRIRVILGAKLCTYAINYARTPNRCRYCLVHGCHAMHAFATHF